MNPNTIHPISGYDNEIYVKPILKNPNMIVYALLEKISQKIFA